MSSKLNHHFVSQFLFRLFTDGQRFVHVLCLKNGDIHPFASIKGQCARHKFYGTSELEDLLADFETRHGAILNKVARFAAGTGPALKTDDEKYLLREAVVLQRCRTPRATRLVQGWWEKILFRIFYEKMRNSAESPSRTAALNAISEGRVRAKGEPLDSIVHSGSV